MDTETQGENRREVSIGTVVTIGRKGKVMDPKSVLLEPAIHLGAVVPNVPDGG